MVSEKISPIYKKAKSLMGIEEQKSTGTEEPEEQKEAPPVPKTNAKDSQEAETQKPQTWRQDLGSFVTGFGFKVESSLQTTSGGIA
eukprot:s371_g23.t3